MIDLSRTRASMLSEIGVIDEAAIAFLTDADDAQFTTLDRARLVIKGLAPDDLLPPLGRALSERFKQVPPAELSRGFLHVLKKTVGNAYKWGNRKDPAKQITADIIVTRKGAVASISDEGEGFDVADLLKRFENKESYATHGGSGFAILEKSPSAVSYTNGGRTVHIEFHCMPGVDSDTAGLAEVSDETFMLDLLRDRPELHLKGESLVGCRISLPSKSKEKNLNIRYELKYQNEESEEQRKRTLTGTLISDGDALAYADRMRGLSHVCSEGTVRIPAPLIAFPDPPLVLSDLDPIGAFGDWIKRNPGFDDFAAQARGIASCLRGVHESNIDVDTLELSEEAKRLCAMGDRIVAVLASASPERAPRARSLCDAMLERWERIQEAPATPIHGSFSWNSIAWTEEGLFLHGFEDPRRSHPGLDLGGFLADHFRFFVMRKKGDRANHKKGEEVFLDAYFAGDSPGWREDLHFFCAVALLQRTERLLGRKQKKWEPKIDPLLDACEQSLDSIE